MDTDEKICKVTMTLMSKENWLKGMLALGIIKDALIPFLDEHYKQTYEEWNNDNHVQHLLDLSAKKELKQTKKDGEKWEVNCSDCKPILVNLMSSHRVAKHLMWMNNKDQNLNEPDEYRLAKVYMGCGNADSRNFHDRDALAILQVCRNDTRLGFGDVANELILFRNRLVHSCDYFVTEVEMTGAFDEMKKLLRNDKLQNKEECITAVKKLNELLKHPMFFERDESNEIWKMHILVQDMALKKESEISQEALNKLLEDIKGQLQKENDQWENAESKRARERRDRQDNERRLQEDNTKLQEEAEEMKRCKSTLA